MDIDIYLCYSVDVPTILILCHTKYTLIPQNIAIIFV